jgi:hypothetical protein
MMSLSSRITRSIGLAFASLAMSVAIAAVFPRVLTAQCGFGDCSLSGGACTNGVCDSDMAYQNAYFDGSCSGAGDVCYHYICWWKDYNYDHSACLNAWCYNSDYWTCTGF